MDIILFALWVFLPAGLANGSPVAASRIPFLRDLKAPMDFGRHYRDRRIFGDNKTWRGLLFGILVAILTVWLQQFLYQNYGWAQSMSGNLDYSTLPTVWLGFLFGAGALLGDAIESFFKRRSGVASGKSWFPFDQLDYIVGGLLLSSLVIPFSLKQYIVIIIVWFAMHVFSVYVGFLLKLRDEPI